MKIAIVIPVVLQSEAILAATLDSIDHLKTQHEAALYVVCNRLSIRLPEALHRELAGRFAGDVVVMYEPGVERSVAGAWNAGCRLALERDPEYIGCVANDTRLRRDCLDLLVAYGERGEADVWSGISYNNRAAIDAEEITHGADFSCFMLRPATLRRFGMFDSNYRPAYFEDNDYYARVILGGGDCHVVHGAQFFHHGSMTIKTDPEMAHHVTYWFEKNRDYFASKWGVRVPENTKDRVIQQYYHHPFNDGSKSVTWFPGDDCAINRRP